MVMAEGVTQRPSAKVEDRPPLPTCALRTCLPLSPGASLGHLSSRPWQFSDSSLVLSSERFILSSERFILSLVAGSAPSWGSDPEPRQAPGTLPAPALRAPPSPRTGSGAHPCSQHPRNKHTRGTAAGRGRSGDRRLLARVYGAPPERTPAGPQRAPLGAGCAALARKTRSPPGEEKGLRHPSLALLLWRTSGGAPEPRQRASVPSSGAGPAAWNPVLPRHPATRTPGRSGRPHLANRTVPCSSGLRLTTRQLCRISSGSGRSMLARGRGAQGRDPRGAGTVTARAAPSPRRRGPLRTPCGPRASAGRGPATAPSQPSVQAPPPCRPSWRFRGTPLRPPALRPAPPRAPRPAPPGWGALKHPRPPPPPVHQGAHLWATALAGDDLVAWEMHGL